ncbi:S-norcoclaurine synthase 1 [Morus notabilis]|uniref:S-norcoclaurine synthase 1 n=1 Tax=Morus notabilis TaxID=981085 RepID=UPI000CECEF1D|nr:S-norcoclaurine synthase 1 [Morus notabilis]
MENEQLQRIDYGGSLPVENVQALASENLKEIPSRYVRPEAEFDQVSVEDHSLEIPTIDMSKLLDEKHPLSPHEELARLHSACRDWGFFQLINHGVPKEVVEKMKIDTHEFFQLPLEKKKTYAQLPNSIEGYGQAFVQSEEQKLDWGDMLFLLARPVSVRNMRFWPTHPTSFRESMDKYSQELHKVAIYLLRFMSWNLGLHSEAVTSLFEDGRQGLRTNFYPPCVQANKALGISPHSDATGLTLLLHVNDGQGLQIKKYGKWVPVKPIPDAFIVNIGDVIEIMSNGEYKSIEHRAVVNTEKNRISVAAFHGPHTKAMVGPLPELVKKSPAKYKTISNEDYLRLLLSRKLDGKNLIDHMKL